MSRRLFHIRRSMRARKKMAICKPNLQAYASIQDPLAAFSPFLRFPDGDFAFLVSRLQGERSRERFAKASHLLVAQSG
jgi:hypothetical protein